MTTLEINFNGTVQPSREPHFRALATVLDQHLNPLFAGKSPRFSGSHNPRRITVAVDETLSEMDKVEIFGNVASIVTMADIGTIDPSATGIAKDKIVFTIKL